MLIHLSLPEYIFLGVEYLDPQTDPTKYGPTVAIPNGLRYILPGPGVWYLLDVSQRRYNAIKEKQ